MVSRKEVIAPLQSALAEEKDEAILPVLRLAMAQPFHKKIAQLQKKQEEEDDGWD
ncbi:MAG: hypothetical protein AAFY72_13180 [Cyanobacteria bacterium J06649_4]